MSTTTYTLLMYPVLCWERYCWPVYWLPTTAYRLSELRARLYVVGTLPFRATFFDRRARWQRPKPAAETHETASGGVRQQIQPPEWRNIRSQKGFMNNVFCARHRRFFSFSPLQCWVLPIFVARSAQGPSYCFVVSSIYLQIFLSLLGRRRRIIFLW